MSEKTKVLVCIKCRAPGESKELPFAERLGGRVHRELAEAAAGAADVEVVPVECFKVCKRPVTIGLAAPGKWTYLLGDFAERSSPAVLEAVRVYAKSPDGLIPNDERPPAFKAATIARTPPTS